MELNDNKWQVQAPIGNPAFHIVKEQNGIWCVLPTLSYFFLFVCLFFSDEGLTVMVWQP